MVLGQRLALYSRQSHAGRFCISSRRRQTRRPRHRVACAFSAPLAPLVLFRQRSRRARGRTLRPDVRGRWSPRLSSSHCPRHERSLLPAWKRQHRSPPCLSVAYGSEPISWADGHLVVFDAQQRTLCCGSWTSHAADGMLLLIRPYIYRTAVPHTYSK